MFTKIVNTLIEVSRIISIIIMFLTMVFITVGVISRAFFKPIIGSVEIVEFGMIVIVMFGLAYTQHKQKHISIDILVQRFSNKVQKLINIFVNLLTILTTMTIGIIFIEVGMKYVTELPMKSSLLSIPYYPFQFIIMFGFIMWGVASLLEFVKSLTLIIVSK